MEEGEEGGARGGGALMMSYVPAIGGEFDVVDLVFEGEMVQDCSLVEVHQQHFSLCQKNKTKQ